MTDRRDPAEDVRAPTPVRDADEPAADAARAAVGGPAPGHGHDGPAEGGAPAHDAPGAGEPGNGAGSDGGRDGQGAGGAPSGGGRRQRSFLVELPVLVLIAFVLALLLKTFVVQAFYIPSESMLPTLAVGDRVLVNKLVHDVRDPERGEVVVFTHDDDVPGAAAAEGLLDQILDTIAGGFGASSGTEKDFIKRIIGLPGETIEMRDGVVLVDGEPIAEAPEAEGGYLSRPDVVDFGPTEIPEGEYFMMGDNRPNSSDSRSLIETVPEEDLVGRAFVVIWPPGRLSTLPLPDYDDPPAGSEAAATP